MKEDERRGGLIPILRAHNPQDCIGTFDDGLIRLKVPLTKDELLETCGNIGFEILEMVEDNGVQKIKAARIWEWSL